MERQEAELRKKAAVDARAAKQLPTNGNAQATGATAATSRYTAANKHRLDVALERARINDIVTRAMDYDGKLVANMHKDVRKIMALYQKANNKLKKNPEMTGVEHMQTLTTVYGGWQFHRIGLEMFKASDAVRRLYDREKKKPAEPIELTNTDISIDADEGSNSESENDEQSGATQTTVQQKDATEQQPIVDEAMDEGDNDDGAGKKVSYKIGPKQITAEKIKEGLQSGMFIACSDECQMPLNWQQRLHGSFGFLSDSLTHEDLSEILLIFEDCSYCLDSHCELGINCLSMKNMLYSLHFHYYNIRYILRVYYAMRSNSIKRQQLWAAIRDYDLKTVDDMVGKRNEVSKVCSSMNVCQDNSR